MPTNRASSPSPRTRVRRLPDRAHYGSETIHDIVDAAYVCSIAFNWNGSVHAMSTAHWRQGDFLYIHGAKASRMLEALETDECCITITHLDALVFARSAFHHSMNFRSAVIYGRFERIPDEEKVASMRLFIDQLSPGRWEQLRPINSKEINATTILRMPLAEASAKIRNWGVKDDEEDMNCPVWAGVVPLTISAGTPETDPLSLCDHPPTIVLRGG